MTAGTSPRAADTEHDPRWAAVLARDAAADGSFFYSVSSTGIYCRPSCPARRPRPVHVRFHATRAEAERAGFRPCRRCRPDAAPADDHARAVAAACRFMEQAEETPPLAVLAARAGFSPSHFRRLFRAATGLTPAAWAAAQRAARLRDGLERGEAIATAIANAGFGSGSRVYEKTDQILGMSPGTYRSGGTGAVIRFAVGECSLGSVLAACSERGICAIALGDDPDALVRELQDRFPRADLCPGDADFDRVIASVVALVEAPATGLALPLDIRGTAFQRRVWQALTKIPPGTTASYTDIARRINAPCAGRAVARACAANPLAVAIPCHRVVRRNGDLSGYRWGVDRKCALLRREAGEGNNN